MSPPQPLSKVSPNARIERGFRGIEKHPDLLQLIGLIITAWPQIDSQVGFSLASFFGSQAHVVIALYTTLRSGSLQGQLLKNAAAVALTGEDLSIFTALIDRSFTISKERAPIAHGYWASSPDMPDALLCIKQESRHKMRAGAVRLWRSSTPAPHPPAVEIDRDDVSVYKAENLSHVYEHIRTLNQQFADFWQMRDGQPRERDQLHARLVGEPLLRQAIHQSQKEGKSDRKSSPPTDPPRPEQK